MLDAHSVRTRGLWTVAPLAGPATRLWILAAALVVRALESVALRRRIHRDRQHLLQLDDRLLADVGLSRHALDAALRRPRRRGGAR